MKRPGSFPWRLYRWFVVKQVFWSAVLFLALSLIVGLTSDSFWLVFFSFGLAFLSVITISLLMARRLLLPLGRLIERTRRMRKNPFDEEEVTPEAMAFDEPGEWYELERALNRLGRDLRTKTIRLSREKTELRAIMSAVSEAVFAISRDRRILFFNPQFTDLFGEVPDPGETRMSEVLRSPDVVEAYTEVLKTGLPIRREVIEEVGADRTPRNFLLSLAPLAKKHNGEIYGAVGIFHDITEMKAAERIRIEFVGNVSHELRTPLTTINGYLQTLESDMKQGRMDHAQEFLKIISDNVKRLRVLVDDLLDLSALESGKDLKFEIIRLQDITESVMSQVNVSNHKVHVVYEVDQMQGDPKRIEQVLRNLMENAVRYVPEGKDIEVRWVAGPDGKTELHVKDNGPGILPKHQPRLFERFYRVDEGRARKEGGTGIGLSLVKHIVQRHGGQVHVKSQVGQGSEFICEFPKLPH